MKEPKELRIVQDDANNIFTSGDHYVIPLYQRAFAWGHKQLQQLIEDIYYFEDEEKYYLGSLVVSDNGDSFEVIDGQQRLTALYLLLTCLGIRVDQSLSFARRRRSDYTLKHLRQILADDHSLDDKDIEDTIRIGISTLNAELCKSTYDKEILKRNLRKVVLYRIEVPPHTDLNRYFEVMNTRGEQLEQHDIIKAQLMGYYDENEVAQKNLFSDIWEACSNMSGYAQMHCERNLRGFLYTSRWNNLPEEQYYRNALEYYLKNVKEASAGEPSITDILNPDFSVETATLDKDNVKVKFESIIEFPFFLLHCLKIYVKQNNITSSDDKPLIPDLMNDKKLLETFNRVIKTGLKDGVSLDRRAFSEGFIFHLLKMRYLFDRFIIKREYIDEKPEGEWSLKELRNSEDKPYFTNTAFHNYYGRGRNDKEKSNRLVLLNKMIQSALRVSYTSPKVMHWITELLEWLAVDDHYVWQIESLDSVAEMIAKMAVRRGFLEKCEEGRYEMGVDTPHIVFNYLDYLLWKKDMSVDFSFEFRNSVEHWYPRNPSNGTFSKWEDGVDCFGNLCLVPNKINSKFSNMDPGSKKATFKDMIQKGSLKLRIMSELTKEGYQWRNEDCEKHESEMIQLLKDSM